MEHQIFSVSPWKRVQICESIKCKSRILLWSHHISAGNDLGFRFSTTFKNQADTTGMLFFHPRSFARTSINPHSGWNLSHRIWARKWFSFDSVSRIPRWVSERKTVLYLNFVFVLEFFSRVCLNWLAHGWCKLKLGNSLSFHKIGETCR